MAIEKLRENFFKTTVCSACNFCKDPQPSFCLALWDADAIKFVDEIVDRIRSLKASGFNMSVLTRIEGFVALFCRVGRCPLYEKDCSELLSNQVTCYVKFLAQAGMGMEKNLIDLGEIYSKWSGIETDKIGSQFSELSGISSKKMRRKSNKLLKKARRAIARRKKVEERKQKVRTALFCNPNIEWKEKILGYLQSNEQPKNNNRQQSQASKCARESS